MNISQAGRKLLRQTIGQFSEFFLLKLLSQFRDMQGVYLCPHSSSVQGLRKGFGSAAKVFISLVCLPLGFVSWILCHSLSISSICRLLHDRELTILGSFLLSCVAKCLKIPQRSPQRFLILHFFYQLRSLSSLCHQSMWMTQTMFGVHSPCSALVQVSIVIPNIA